MTLIFVYGVMVIFICFLFLHDKFSLVSIQAVTFRLACVRVKEVTLYLVLVYPEMASKYLLHRITTV